MKTITAYQCEFCDKVYERKESCQGHERRCYKNPKTGSCASRAFLKKQGFEIGPAAFIDLNVCLQNIDLAQSLKTKCLAYIQARRDEEWDVKVDPPAHKYDRVLAEQRLAEKIDWYRKDHQKYLKMIQENEECLDEADDMTSTDKSAI